MQAQTPAQWEIVGRWSADARLFDMHIRASTTPLAAELVIAADLSLSGQIGDATMASSSPVAKTPTRLEYRIRLNRPVHAHPDLGKDHLIVIITRRDGPDGPVLDADFHLKSRFGFDPTLRVGHFDAVRVVP